MVRWVQGYGGIFIPAHPVGEGVVPPALALPEPPGPPCGGPSGL